MDNSALIAEWEARLAAEGLAPVGTAAWLPYDEWHYHPSTLGDVGLRDKTAEERAVFRAQLEPLLVRLPDYHRVVVELRLTGLYQWQIGDVLGLSQVSISRRLVRATQCLKVLAEHPAPTDEELAAYEPRPDAREMIVLYLRLWNGLQVSRLLGIHQSWFWRSVIVPARKRKSWSPIARLILAVPTTYPNRLRHLEDAKRVLAEVLPALDGVGSIPPGLAALAPRVPSRAGL